MKIKTIDANNVIRDSPSTDSSGSMPLGNGDIGLNVWVERRRSPFFLAKSDAWSAAKLEAFKVTPPERRQDVILPPGMQPPEIDTLYPPI
jgi:Domain of unknown function (DUF5703)